MLNELWVIKLQRFLAGTEFTLSISCRCAIGITCCPWVSSPWTHPAGGLSSTDLNAQLLRNRQGWLKVPHIANLGVFNQGTIPAKGSWVFHWLDGRGQLRGRKTCSVMASLRRPYQECETPWGPNSCQYKWCHLEVKTPKQLKDRPSQENKNGNKAKYCPSWGP